jgi:hypothetical protein
MIEFVSVMAASGKKHDQVCSLIVVGEVSLK